MTEGRPSCSACARRNSDACSYKRASTVFRRHHAPTVGYGPESSSASTFHITAAPGSSHGTLDAENVDGVVTIGGDGNDESPYGPSSTIAFVRQVAEGGSVTDSVASRAASRRPKHPNVLLSEPLYARDSQSFVLPQRYLADDFVKCFWTFVHPVFPILHEPATTETYNKLWLPNTSATDSDPYSLPMLNLVFALGCQYSNFVAVKTRGTMAREHYLRSRRAFNFDILDSTSLTHVQLLLLMGVYLQSSQYASQCWNVIGLAVRCAQGLGLHLERDDSPFSRTERVLRRTVWHNCVCLDRLLSMTFGRPAMIANTQVPLPPIVDGHRLGG